MLKETKHNLHHTTYIQRKPKTCLWDLSILHWKTCYFHYPHVSFCHTSIPIINNLEEKKIVLGNFLMKKYCEKRENIISGRKQIFHWNCLFKVHTHFFFPDEKINYSLTLNGCGWYLLLRKLYPLNRKVEEFL